MAESSFDIVSKLNWQELDNAVNHATKEISQRFDFKGTKCNIEFLKDEKSINLIADDDYKLKAVRDVFESKCIKRGISIYGTFEYKNPEPASGGTLRQPVKVNEGIEHEKAKEIVNVIKELKLKVQAQIRGEEIRVSGKSKDDLQSVIRVLKEKNFKIPIQFINYR